MSMRIIDENGIALKRFYKTDLGMAFGLKIIKSIFKIWNPRDIGSDEKILYCGYNSPYVNIYDGELTSDIQVTKFTAFNGPDNNSDVIVDALKMPLRNAQYNRMISAHALENCESAEDLLAEFWRVLEPEGRLILLVVNKGGLWKEHPIAGENTHSKTDIEQLLTTSKFKIRSFSRAIYFPAVKSLFVAKVLDAMFRVIPSTSGVMIFEAEKRIYAPRGRTIKIVPSLLEKITGKKRAVSTKDIA